MLFFIFSYTFDCRKFQIKTKIFYILFLKNWKINDNFTFSAYK